MRLDVNGAERTAKDSRKLAAGRLRIALAKEMAILLAPYQFDGCLHATILAKDWTAYE
jgi:hypothetical protein